MNCNDSMINNSMLKKMNDPGRNFKSLPFQTDISAINLLKTRLNGSANGTRTLSFLEKRICQKTNTKHQQKIFWISVKLTMSHVSYILTGKQRWSLDMMPFICHCLCYGSYLPSRRIIYKVRIRQSRRVFMLQTSIKSAHLFILSRMPWKQNGSVRPM